MPTHHAPLGEPVEHGPLEPFGPAGEGGTGEAEVVLRAEVEVVGGQGFEGGEGRSAGLLLEAFEEHQGLRMVVKN